MFLVVYTVRIIANNVNKLGVGLFDLFFYSDHFVVVQLSDMNSY